MPKLIELACDEQIDIYQHNLQEISVEHLRSLLSVVKGCADCEGCNGQVSYLEKLIKEKEGKIS